MSLSLLAKTLITLGPEAVRLAGSKLGNQKAGDVAADVVQVVARQYSTPEAQLMAAEQALKALPAPDLEQVLSLKVALAEEATKQQIAMKQLIQQGDNAADEVVRRARPKMAKLSLYAAIAYVFVFELVKVFGHGTGPSMEVMLFLMSAPLGYMGLRTLDGFAPYSKASGDKALSLMRLK